MNNKQTILLALSVFTASSAFAIEAQQSNENEKGVIETLISNGLYFQIGGGLAQFKDDPYKNDNDITSLKYNIGISTQPFNFELGYQSFSDGDGFSMKGVDILAKHKWSLSRDGGLFAGAGGYFYNAEMNKQFLDSPPETSGVSPYLSVGGYYALSEYIDVSLQFDSFFNVSVIDQYYDKKDSKQLNQVSLSLILHPWSNSRYDAQPIESIEEPVKQQVKLGQNSAEYSYDDATLSSEMEEQLTRFAIKVTELESYDVVIIGGADSKPAFVEYNTRLARKRAKRVADFLILHGVDERNIHLETSVVEKEESDQDARKVEMVVKGTKVFNAY
ncbi:OmpA family protein [Vibrio tetraodonis]|uniref:OmpA family protein n=1 Tax=Vibrio tetraodonis TaxID=2231647 RepID=UPI000E0A6EDE|nr:OmpA family protein [Vibrio tetraodonis]